MSNCTNPSAINYNPLATEDDGSCIYLHKIDGVCHAFQDAPQIEDRSFTLSYALEGDNWVFFHDYIPDYYFSTREKLHSVKNNRLWTHNSGPAGQYYNSTTPSPFFVDMVFRGEDEMTLNSISWITEVFDRVTKANEEFKTLSHVTIWNSWQCTGRIPIAQIFDTLEMKNVRKTQSEWNLNEFRDLVAVRGAKVVGDLFQNFAVNTAALDADMSWYDQKLLEDRYFIVRLEFDNKDQNADKVVLLHSAEVDANKSYL